MFLVLYWVVPHRVCVSREINFYLLNVFKIFINDFNFSLINFYNRFL